MSSPKVILPLLLIMLNVQISADELQQRPQKPRLVLVQRIAGIKIGPQFNVADDVVARFGQGHFEPDEGHCGGRYYTNKEETLTLHFEFGVDNMVDTVELEEGCDVLGASKPDVLHNSISPALGKTVEIDRGITLGMRPSALIHKLGTPTEDGIANGRRVIKYAVDSETDPRVGLDYEATYTFNKERLIKISLYDGE